MSSYQYTIGFDASVTLAPNRGGIARYTLELLKGLVELETPDMQFVVLLNSLRHSPNADHQFLFDSPKVKVHRSRWPGTMVVKGWGKNKWPQWEDLVKTPCNLVHAPAGYLPSTRKTPVVLTIHDLAFLREKHKDPLAGAWFERVYHGRLQSTSGIITPSHFVADEIFNTYQLPKESIHAIHSGIDLKRFSQNPETDKKLDVLGITSSGIERKRTEWIAPIIQLAEQKLGGKIYCQVLGGTPKECPPSIEILPRLSDQELAEKYRQAKVTLFPTKEEGFGFPVLESIASGTPVVCGKNSSLTEIGGSVATYAEEDTIEGYAQALAKQIDMIPSKDWREKATSHARQFKWETTAKKVLDVYLNVLKKI